MAKRPVFRPLSDRPGVRVATIEFTWHPGFAKVQKQKSVASLHASAEERGIVPLLEVSSASESRLGASLSAFILRVGHPELGAIPLESAFQGSKVFAGEGPFEDLLVASPRDAKRDPRIRGSGPLTAFRFADTEFPLEPKTLFYDWLYFQALSRLPEETVEAAAGFEGYTDISFNPKRSINCQASALALFTSFRAAGVERPWDLSPEELAERGYGRGPAPRQGSLL